MSERAQEFLREIRAEFDLASPATYTRVECLAIALGHAVDEWGRRSGAASPDEVIEAALTLAAATGKDSTGSRVGSAR